MDMAGRCGIFEDKVEFVKRYLTPISRPKQPYTPLQTNQFSELEDVADPDEMLITRIFADAINQCDGLAPGLKLATCGSRPDSSVSTPEPKTKENPNLALFRTSSMPHTGDPHWFDQLFTVVITCPTGKNVPGVPNSSNGAKFANILDILCCIELLFMVQQRLAVFTLFVVRRQCYIIRWDHSGFVITDAIDYCSEWKFFTEVLWRISQCSDAQLGLDPTAHRLLPSDPDYQLMTDVSKSLETDLDHTERDFDPDEGMTQQPCVFSYVRTAFADSLNPLWPRYRLEVTDGDRSRTFLVGKPRFRAKGLFGRATRGYVALDCQTRLFVWLKDTWRAHNVLTEREGDTLGRLNQANVTHIPTLICHGDIAGHVTLTPRVWEEKHARHTNETAGRKRKQETDEGKDDGRNSWPRRSLQHYRLVVEEVALPLSEFQYGQQLVRIIGDCIVAHWEASEALALLHGDISDGNVLMYPKVLEGDNGLVLRLTGILADWEMARPASATHPATLGTKSFMSVARLSLIKPVEVCDELESFYYLLLYIAVRYLRSDSSDATVANFVQQFFNEYSFADGRLVCGWRKLHTIATGSLAMAHTVPLVFDTPMDHILRTMLCWIKAHHAVWRYTLCEEMERPEASPARNSAESAHPGLPVAAPRSPSPKFDSEPVHPPDGTPWREPIKRFPEPSPRDRKLAPSVATHLDMLKLLIQTEGMAGWPVDDKVGDRISRSWCRDEMYDSDSSHTLASNTAKKRRIA